MCVYIDDAFLAGTFDNALVQVRVKDFWKNCEYVEAHMGRVYLIYFCLKIQRVDFPGFICIILA